MRFLDALFSCNHKHLSFPITLRAAKRRTPAASVTGTYVVCLDCGHEFPYDWEAMRVVRGTTAAAPQPALNTAPKKVA